jgi:hypothetical protein
MNKKINIIIAALLAVIVSCNPDESLYPLPYDDRESGAYLRNYKITTNVWDFDDLPNSAFEIVFESVDVNWGADLELIEVFATHKNGATGLITDEALVKTFDASSFSTVAEPTISEYLRSSPLRITADETLTALQTLTTDPDGTLGDGNCTGIFPKVCTMVAFPGAFAANDQVIYRWAITLKDGRKFTVFNPQNAVTPALGNPNEANITPNITGGQFYSAPHQWTVAIRRTTTTANPNAYTGTYRMSQVALWSPYHSAAQHASFFPSSKDEYLFGTSATDSSQTITLSKVTGALPTEREFTCKYRGQDITIRINLEPNTSAGLSAAALTTVTTAAPLGLGVTGATNANLGFVWVPLMNTGVTCSGDRQFYMVTPLGGEFAGATTLPWGLPRRQFPNRGVYRMDQDGLTAGQTFTIAVDDDVDEYGRRNGYCWWYRRVYMTLTKL